MASGSMATGSHSLETSDSSANATPTEAVAVSRQRATAALWGFARWNPLSRVWPVPATPGVQAPAPVPAASHESLLLFAPETGAGVPVTGAAPPSRTRVLRVAPWLLFAATAAVGTSAGAYEIYKRGASWPVLEGQPARLTIDSRPSGAEVIVDERPHGVTPLTTTLGAGSHTIRIAHGGEVRVLPLQVAAGAEITQYIEFTERSQAPVLSGRTSAISVITEPAGAQVTVDGGSRGTSPVTIVDLTVGSHVIGVTGTTGSAERAVTTKPGATTAVVFSLPRAAAVVAPGWLTVLAPFEVSLREGDDLVGTSHVSKIMLPAGRHNLTLSNDRLEYRESRDVEIAPGKTAILRVEATGVLSLNARPWAEVQLDTRQIGQTPLANVSVTVGTHQVVFRHPQLGERRVSIDVKAQGPNRLAVDMTAATGPAVPSDASK